MSNYSFSRIDHPVSRTANLGDEMTFWRHLRVFASGSFTGSGWSSTRKNHSFNDSNGFLIDFVIFSRFRGVPGTFDHGREGKYGTRGLSDFILRS
jgi:hypothetical protein